MAPELTQQNINLAERRMQQIMDASPCALGARYDATGKRIVVQRGSGVELAFPGTASLMLAGNKIELLCATGFEWQAAAQFVGLFRLAGAYQLISSAIVVRLLGPAGWASPYQ